MNTNDSDSEQEIDMRISVLNSPSAVSELNQNLIGEGEAGSSAKSTGSSHSTEDELFGLDESSSRFLQFSVLVKQSFPVIVSFFLTVGGTFVNLIFAGQYVHETGDKSAVFAGVSLANMFANVSCLSLLIGMSSAVETLGSQHNGAGNYKEVGYVLQRSILILGVMTIPVIILWFFTADIFAALGVEPHVCLVIRNFIRIRALTIPMDVIAESYEKYLMSIGVMNPSMWMNVCFNGFILSFDLLFVYGLNLHYECLAWSWVISVYLSSIIQVALSWNHPSVQRTLQPWDRKALTQWWEFIQLGLPGTVMLCSEWWAYEILTIFASVLGTAQVAAQTIIMQTASLAFMIPLGIGVACSSLVGNALGASKKNLAISLGKMSLVVILVMEIGVSIVMFCAGSYFVDAFTNDENVKEVANRAIPFLCLFTFIDGLQGVASGVLRGAGKQFIGAVANLIAFYIIGLPMAWLVCFKMGYGVNGLMLGMAFGTSFQVTVLVVMILFFEPYIYSSHIAHSLPITAPVHTADHAVVVGAGVSSPKAKRGKKKKTKNGFIQLASDDHDDSQSDSERGIAMSDLSRDRQDGVDTYVRL